MSRRGSVTSLQEGPLTQSVVAQRQAGQRALSRAVAPRVAPAGEDTLKPSASDPAASFAASGKGFEVSAVRSGAEASRDARVQWPHMRIRAGASCQCRLLALLLHICRHQRPLRGGYSGPGRHELDCAREAARHGAALLGVRSRAHADTLPCCCLDAASGEAWQMRADGCGAGASLAVRVKPPDTALHCWACGAVLMRTPCGAAACLPPLARPARRMLRICGAGASQSACVGVPEVTNRGRRCSALLCCCAAAWRPVLPLRRALIRAC